MFAPSIFLLTLATRNTQSRVCDHYPQVAIGKLLATQERESGSGFRNILNRFIWWCSPLVLFWYEIAHHSVCIGWRGTSWVTTSSQMNSSQSGQRLGLDVPWRRRSRRCAIRFRILGSCTIVFVIERKLIFSALSPLAWTQWCWRLRCINGGVQWGVIEVNTDTASFALSFCQTSQGICLIISWILN